MKKFWRILKKYEIPEISDILLDINEKRFHFNRKKLSSSNWEDFTQTYEHFCFNINKIASFLFDLKTIEKSLDNSPINASFQARRINLQFMGICEFILIYLATTIEIYLEDSFRIASKKILLNNLDPSILKKFMNRFKLTSNPSNTKLTDILEKRMDFQNKENIKIAYKLLGVDLPNLVGQLWQDILDTNNDGSLMQLRHRIVHNGLEMMLDHIFTFKEVYNTTLKVIEFVYKLEKERKDSLPVEKIMLLRD